MSGLLPGAAELRRFAASVAPYLGAAAVYIGLGVWQPRFLLSWTEGVAFLFLFIWAVPAAYRRWRR